MDSIRRFVTKCQDLDSRHVFHLSMVSSFYDDDLGRNQFRIDRDVFEVEMASEWGEAKMRVMENVFKRLHAVLITHDTPALQVDPMAMPTVDSINNAVKADKSPLHRCVFALCYGKSMLNASLA